MMKEDDHRLVFVPMDQMQVTPIEGIVVSLLNHWWVVHPEKGAVFYRATSNSKDLKPQCNANEYVARTLCDKLYPWGELKQIPQVFLRYIS